MKYKDYIELGFTREDMDDNVEFDHTGYSGYALTRHYDDRIMIQVASGELDHPLLFIKKTECTYHIIKITPEVVNDMFKNKTT